MAGTILIPLLVLSLTCHCSDSIISVSTPDQRGYIPLEPYGVSVKSVSHIRFRVKSTSNAHIGLYDAEASSNVSNSLYEIVLGGWDNTISVIRKIEQGQSLVSVNHNVLSSSEFKPFWVSWDDGVKVGAGTTVGENTFLFLNDSSYAVKYIAIYTAWGSTGEWEFEEDGLSSSITTSSLKSPVSSILLVTSDGFEIASTLISSTGMFQLDLSTVAFKSPIFATTHMTRNQESKTSEPSSEIGYTSTSTLPESWTPNNMKTPTISLSDIGSTPVSHTTSTQELNVETPLSNLYDNSKYSKIESTAVMTFESSEINEVPGSSTEIVIQSTSTFDATASDLNTLSETTARTNRFETLLFSSTTPVNSQNRVCGCRCVRFNVSRIEIQTFIEEISKALLVPKHHLSSTRRKKTSAHDKRQSSQGIGAGAVILAILPIILILLADLQNLFRMFGKRNNPKRS